MSSGKIANPLVPKSMRFFCAISYNSCDFWFLADPVSRPGSDSRRCLLSGRSPKLRLSVSQRCSGSYSPLGFLPNPTTIDHAIFFRFFFERNRGYPSCDAIAVFFPLTTIRTSHILIFSAPVVLNNDGCTYQWLLICRFPGLPV